MDQERAAAYLEHIGAERPARPDLDALRALHLAHLRTVPFENLSIHRGEDIVLAPGPLVAKVVDRGRGGFCYELNGAFAELLRALGYEVELLTCRSFGDGGELGPPFDHMALRVRTEDGAVWLADVGFGRHSHFPLSYGSRAEQPEPGGVFTLREAPDGDLDVLRDDEPQYRVEQRPRGLGDFAATCWWQRTSPLSHFRTSLVCSRLTADGRVTLSGRTLVRTAGGSRQERELPGPAEVLAAYREHFGIALDREPVLVAAPAG
ncbi:arylamine N-acetyltransferase [Streptomyces sp. NPDC087270]|uniref:arylamine N-acetyltransferase family protein n=1 Tax=Streptomyces sp. NPDC087270 TaxID=3365774 RepID=UPI00380BB5B2